MAFLAMEEVTNAATGIASTACSTSADPLGENVLITRDGCGVLTKQVPLLDPVTTTAAE
jgi:hypothetical protein